MKNRPRVVERRRRRRIKAAVNAVLRAEGSTHRCRIYDISPGGMTLLTGPHIPKTRRFQVQCDSGEGTQVVFEVQEKQRRELRQGAYRFLRLGLNIVQANGASRNFFSSIASQDAALRAEKPAPAAAVQDQQADASTSQTSPSPTRAFHRLQFQLPVLARIDDKVYRCHTVDISARGLCIQTPKEFPETRTAFPLVYLEPEGAEVGLRVKETYRSAAGENRDAWRIGLQAVGGSRAFFAFLEKHRLLREPDTQ